MWHRPVAGRLRILALVLHPFLELTERGPVAGQYGSHVSGLLTVAVEVGVHVVAVLDLVVAVHAALAGILDEGPVAVRVESHWQQDIVCAVQGKHGLAYVPGQGDLLYRILDPVGPLRVAVLGVAARLGVAVLLAERVAGLLLAIVARIELLPVDALGKIPVR
jgi:hypothetical protein